MEDPLRIAIGKRTKKPKSKKNMHNCTKKMLSDEPKQNYSCLAMGYLADFIVTNYITALNEQIVNVALSIIYRFGHDSIYHTRNFKETNFSHFMHSKFLVISLLSIVCTLRN